MPHGVSEGNKARNQSRIGGVADSDSDIIDSAARYVMWINRNRKPYGGIGSLVIVPGERPSGRDLYLQKLFGIYARSSS